MPASSSLPSPSPIAEILGFDPADMPMLRRKAFLRDRRAEEAQTLAIRQMQRDVELARLEIAAEHAIELAEIEAASMRLTERKLRIDQQHRLSRAIAGDDPVLQAKFAVLDDDFFHAQRMGELRKANGS